MFKKLILFATTIVIVALSGFGEVKATEIICDPAQGWGEGECTTWVLNSNGVLCEVEIIYCVRLRVEGGQSYLDMQYDHAHYKDPDCGYFVQQMALFWGTVNEAIWKDLYKMLPNVFPPCSTGTWVVVTFSVNHCYKLFNHCVDLNPIPDPNFSPTLDLLPCPESNYLCEEVWKVCTVLLAGGIKEYQKDLISKTSTVVTDCPIFNWVFDPLIYPPNIPWVTPCYNMGYCQ